MWLMLIVNYVTLFHCLYVAIFEFVEDSLPILEGFNCRTASLRISFLCYWHKMVNVLETSWNWSGEAVHTSASHSTCAIVDSVNTAASTSTHP